VFSSEAVFKKTWLLDPMLELTITSPHLVVDSEVSFPPQTTKGKGRDGNVSPISWAHLYLSANNGTANRKRERTRKGEGRAGS